MNPEDQPELTPDAERAMAQLQRYLAWREYRRRTRPFRRTFRGIITRKEAERLFLAQVRRTQRAMGGAVGA